jgi:hypothetical protein
MKAMDVINPRPATNSSEFRGRGEFRDRGAPNHIYQYGFARTVTIEAV